jgi:hypothetical protein
MLLGEMRRVHVSDLHTFFTANNRTILRVGGG